MLDSGIRQGGLHMYSHFETLLTIRSASFNDEAAVELLRELGRLPLTPEMVFRINDIVAHLEHDAKALEALYSVLRNGFSHSQSACGS
jgi:hypothetical protein